MERALHNSRVNVKTYTVGYSAIHVRDVFRKILLTLSLGDLEIREKWNAKNVSPLTVIAAAYITYIFSVHARRTQCDEWTIEQDTLRSFLCPVGFAPMTEIFICLTDGEILLASCQSSHVPLFHFSFCLFLYLKKRNKKKEYGTRRKKQSGTITYAQLESLIAGDFILWIIRRWEFSRARNVFTINFSYSN